MPTRSQSADADAAVAILERSRACVTPKLRDAVHTMPASIRTVAGYHLGWWDRDGRPEDTDGGKALRPTLALLAARAVGGSTDAALPAAVAVELVHNFSLLHDDVMDGDTTRRHRTTAWVAFGTGPAILAGDALLTRALELVAVSGHARATEVTELISRAVSRLIEGQFADVSFEQRSDVDVTECLAMTDDKTGALFECATTAGGMFGDAGPDDLRRLREFGRLCGRAFQHADDLLGIWGDPEVTGKSAYSDLRSHKKSLPVVWALHSGTEAGAALADLYARDAPLDDTEAEKAAELVDAAGGRAWSRQQARQLGEQAVDTLSGIDADPAAVADLQLLAALTADRAS